MRYKFGIRQKAALYMSLTVFSLMVIGFLLVYFVSFKMIEKDIESKFDIIANLISQQISTKIEDEIGDLRFVAKDPILIEAVAQSNMQYQNMGPDDVRKSIEAIESRWASEGEDSLLIKKYTDSAAGIELKKVLTSNKELAELFITDRRGALVASSGRTSDFYQSDESWWTSAYAGGRGEDYLGDVELDQSSNTLSIPFVFPLKSTDGNVIGIIKAVTDIRSLFSFLPKLKIGRTGTVSLINEKGEIIIMAGAVPLSAKIMCDSCLKKALSGDHVSMTGSACDMEQVKKFRVFRTIVSPSLDRKGIIWRVVVSQKTNEAFAPLYRSITWAFLLIAILSALTLPLSYFFGNLIASPIQKLHKAIDILRVGEMDYNVDIRTQDEIEDLARAFGTMVSSIKNSEEKLLKSKAYTDSIISSMADSLVVVDRDGKIRYVNKSGLQLLGYAENELIGISADEILLNPEEEPGLNKYLEQVYEKGLIYNVGLSYVSKDGTPIPINMNAAVMYEGAKITGIVTIARDMRPIMAIVGDLEKSKSDLEERNKYLTKMQKAMLHIMKDLKITKDDLRISYDKLREAQDKIVQSEKEAALGRFSTGIAHEVKNPIAMILAGAEYLEAKLVSSDENIRRNMMMVKKSALRANEILEGILMYIRPSLLKIENVDLNEIADEVVQLFKIQSSTVKADIVSELSAAEIRVNVDKIQIHQVLFNVIKNAIEASPEYGRIIIRTDTVNNDGIISIIDNGTGISKEVMSNIFEPFFSTKRPGRGTGLGLAMAKTIIDRHKGKLTFDSEEGKGTTVKVILPLAQ